MFRVLALFLLAVSAHAVEVRDVRIVSGTGTQRVVLDLSGRTSHRLSTMANPDRLVIDLDHTRARLARFKALGAAGSVRSVRAAPRGNGGLRVVVDMGRHVRARSFFKGSSHRAAAQLVIEWRETSAPLNAGANDAAAAPAGSAVPASSAAPGKAVRVEHAPPPARNLTIAIDAGHGGTDPGATGMNGTHEKDVVLAIARALAQQVNVETGMRAVLIRDGDYFIPLRDRMGRARRQQADLFVSIHADSIRNRAITGSSVYILSQRGATDEAARWLAERENAADLMGGVALDNKDDVLASVLLDLSQTAALSASQAAAYSVLHRLDGIGEIRKREVQQARFVVLKSPDIPSMLVETAYISNPGEERRLRSRDYQDRLASAIQQGLRDYFYANPPAGTRVAQLAGRKDSVPSASIMGARDDSGG